MKSSDKKYSFEGLEIVIARSPDEIEAIRPIWEKMQHNEPYPVINADIDRFLSVIEAGGDSMRPHIVLVKQNGQPRAMIIGRLEKHPVELKLGYKTLLSPNLKCLTIVYGGILGQPEKELCSYLIGKLMKMFHRHEVDLLFFNNLRVDSHLYQRARKIPGILSRGYFPRIQSHWQTHIPENVESFYERIPSKHKREWRRCERRLAKECKGPVEVLCSRKESQINQIMRVACDISERSYKHAMNVGITDDACTRALLGQAARKDSLRAYILYVNKVPCAFEFGLHYGETFFVEYMGYDRAWSSFGPGALLWVKAIEDLCTHSATNVLDYGFGDAPYKQRLGTKVWQEASVYIFAPRAYPIFINMVRTSTMGLNVGLEYILKKTGLVGWIKRCWRNLLQIRNTPRGISQVQRHKFTGRFGTSCGEESGKHRNPTTSVGSDTG